MTSIKRKKKYLTSFPWRLYRWFLFRQILFYMGIFSVLGVSALWIIKSNTPMESQWIAQETMLLTLIGGLLAATLTSVLVGQQLITPLGRLIAKTRRLRKFPFDSEDYSDFELASDEPGEWYDLERALNKLGRDLKSKTVRLSREKTELRAIMSSVNEAILSVAPDGRPIFYNSKFALMFGLQDLDASDVAVSELVRSPEILDAYNECLRIGETLKIETEFSIPGEAAHRNFSVSVSPLRKKHNQEIYGAVGIFHDITELKRTEKVRIEFVGNASHELRTPLTTILGYVQTLQDDVKSNRLDQASEFLDIINQNTQRLLALVNDLKDLSNLESGMQMQQSVVNTRELTEGVIRQLDTSDHKVLLRFNVSQFTADPLRVEQVLRNLLENAIRYVPKGQRIEVDWNQNESNQVQLVVEDDGPGIRNEHQARLFERFYRVDTGRSRNVGGTGIGLSIVKHIMQSHGGNVELVSSIGKGSKFVCHFPN